MKIIEDTILADILKVKGAEEILTNFNVPCLDCPFAKFEIENLKIGEVCEKYGINTNKLLEELNKNIKVKN